MDPEKEVTEREVQNAIGSLNMYAIYVTVNIAAVNTYCIRIKAVNEAEAYARAKALYESDKSIDDFGNDFYDSCNTEYDPVQEFGEPDFAAYLEE